MSSTTGPAARATAEWSAPPLIVPSARVADSGIDRQCYPGDVATGLADQVQHRATDVDRVHHLDGQGVLEGVRGLDVLLHVGGEEVVDHHRRVTPGGGHGVDAGSVLCQAWGVGAGQTEDAWLRRGRRSGT